MELTWRTIWWCLMQVPVRHWWMLIHNLRRLDATFELARSEGRSWLRWHLRDDGVIFVSAWELTDAEKKRRFALPENFDRHAWLRAAPADLTGFAGLSLALAPCTEIAPSPHRGRTVSAPWAAPLFAGGAPLFHPP